MALRLVTIGSAVVAALLGASLPAPLARADADWRMGAGGGVSDLGDGRFQPVAMAEFGMPALALARYHAFGMRNDRFRQYGGASSLGREWMFAKGWLRARAGLAHLWETTRIRDDAGGEMSSTSHNGGFAFGFAARASIGRVGVALDWQNNCHVSGFNGILGSFGRRQFVTLEVGVGL
jgi:hypothetical protein